MNHGLLNICCVSGKRIYRCGYITNYIWFFINIVRCKGVVSAVDGRGRESPKELDEQLKLYLPRYTELLVSKWKLETEGCRYGDKSIGPSSSEEVSDIHQRRRQMSFIRDWLNY